MPAASNADKAYCQCFRMACTAATHRKKANGTAHIMKSSIHLSFHIERRAEPSGRLPGRQSRTGEDREAPADCSPARSAGAIQLERSSARRSRSRLRDGERLPNRTTTRRVVGTVQAMVRFVLFLPVLIWTTIYIPRMIGMTQIPISMAMAFRCAM